MGISRKLIIKVLCDLRFAAILFFLLALCILLGSFIPQEKLVGRSFLIQEFGEARYLFFRIVGLIDIFNSWWYLLLVFLLYLSLITVSFKKVFPRAKKAFIRYKFLSVEGFQKLKSNRKNFSYQVLQAEKKNLTSLQLDLERQGYQVQLDQNKYSLVAQKNQIFRLAASITHVGILIILFACFLNLLFGFSGLVIGSPGEQKQAQIFHSRFWLGQVPSIKLKILSTEEKLNKLGTPEQWLTRLEFKDQVKEISVNQPVRISGVDFYQANWQEYFKFQFNQDLFRVKAETVFAEKKSKTGKLKINQNFQLFFFKAENSSKVNLVVVKDKNYQNFLFEKGEQKEINDLMKIKYLGVEKETGLQLKYRPFDWLIYLGMIFLVSGVICALIKTKVIWAILNQQEQTIETLSLD